VGPGQRPKTDQGLFLFFNGVFELPSPRKAQKRDKTNREKNGLDFLVDSFVKTFGGVMSLKLRASPTRATMATPFAHKSLSINVTTPGFPPLPSVLLRLSQSPSSSSPSSTSSSAPKARSNCKNISTRFFKVFAVMFLSSIAEKHKYAIKQTKKREENLTLKILSFFSAWKKGFRHGLFAKTQPAPRGSGCNCSLFLPLGKTMQPSEAIRPFNGSTSSILESHVAPLARRHPSMHKERKKYTRQLKSGERELVQCAKKKVLPASAFSGK
jgi:hypothetical protein